MSNKTHLRDDGVYIQFGNNHWATEGHVTNICWYNLMVVINNEQLLLLGSSISPFWEKDNELYYLKEDMYSYLGISNPSDPLQTAYEISKLPLHKLDELFDSDSVWDLTTPFTKDSDKDVAFVQSENDEFILRYEDNPLVLYDYGSENRLQKKNGVFVENNFPFIFVPDDHSSKWSWDYAYVEWIKHRNKEDYAYCDICEEHHTKFYYNDCNETDVCLDCGNTFEGKRLIKSHRLKLD